MSGYRSGIEVNSDCERCRGSGFIMLLDYDGPGLHDEDNCPCTRGTCDCSSCEALSAEAEAGKR